MIAPGRQVPAKPGCLGARRSVRSFIDRPVDEETILSVVQAAQRSPSSMNSQPWKIYALSGKRLDALRERNVELLRSGRAVDVEFPSALWPKDSVYRNRQIDLAQQLFTALGIAREDREKRSWWFEQGFRYFGAPLVFFLTLDRIFPELFGRFEVGVLAQSMCLAAFDHGLGACIDQQGVSYSAAVCEAVGIPDSEQLIISIAVGFPDWSQPVNGFITKRESIDEVLVRVT